MDKQNFNFDFLLKNGNGGSCILWQREEEEMYTTKS